VDLFTAVQPDVETRAPEPEPHLVSGDASPLHCQDLFHDAASLGPMLLREVQRDSWLDAFLLAAGLSQIVEDYLHPDPYLLGKVADVLTGLPTPLGARAAGLARGARTAALTLAAAGASHRRLASWHERLSILLERLADAVVAPGRPQPLIAYSTDIVTLCAALTDEMAAFPADLLRTVGRLPSCFRSFDQQPSDLAWMAHQFAQRWPDRDRPVVVVGVRSSGSYLAPLSAAYLRAAGYAAVVTLTIRPGREPRSQQQQTLRTMVGRDALVIVTDDPRASGRSIARAIDDLVQIGVPERSIVLFLQLFGPRATLPAVLRRYAAVLLPWIDWSIQARLEPAAVRSALARMMGPAVKIGRVERLPLRPASSPRGHIRALYRVQVNDRGQIRDELVLVRGTGLGYFGRHSLAVSDALGEFLPRVYGFQDGLLYRAWIPDEQAIGEPEPRVDRELAERAVGYVVARRKALAVPHDLSERLIGEWPAWEVASTLLSRVFGRGWIAARIPLIDPIVRTLLQVQHPAVVDANMALDRWFGGSACDEPLLKVGFDKGIFRGDVELACYDPIFDLASLVTSIDLADGSGERATEIADLLRAEYERATGESVDDERWLLYQLVRLWDEQRAARVSDHNADTRFDRARARAIQQYFAARFFADVTPGAAGPICAVDVDGVLETSPLGFPGLAPSSARGLRALARHGYRAVVVTGRSLDEVRERCHAYRLAGGVAEYGSATYVTATGQVTDLLSADERDDLDRLRTTLAHLDSVYLDPDYRSAVRAHRPGPGGHRRGLSPELAQHAIAESGVEGRIRAIAGESQTDFVAASIDKGAGLRTLLGALDRSAQAQTPSTVALAVGDTVSDLPMLAPARLALAPAHAGADVRAAGVGLVRRPYQAGFAEAVGRLIGHAAGGCPSCQPPQPSAPTRLLLQVLATPEAGQRGLIVNALRLAFTAVKLPRARQVAPSAMPTLSGTGD